jgi:site-specific recombinase XerD
MIEAMQLRRMSPKTIEAYVAAIVDLSRFYGGRSPDRISLEEVRKYVHHAIVERRLSYSTVNQRVSAIQFFWRYVLGQECARLEIPAKSSGGVADPLGRGEVARLLEATTNRKHRVLLMTTYGGGFRVSEVVRLRPEHILSDRMLIRIVEAKGHRDRYTLLSPRMLEELRAYWREYRPGEWVFAGRHGNHLSISSAQMVYRRAWQAAGLTHGHGIHSLRHSFATHLLESGANVVAIQRLLGHADVSTTSHYLGITTQHLRELSSPLDLLRLPAETDRLA